MEYSEGKMLLLVGDIGYAVTCIQSPSHLGYAVGSNAEIYVHTHVREDALDLYGFISKYDKDLFLTLLTVNGIGPKGASGILSKIESHDLIQAILSGDKGALTSVSGIGKKIAERVVVELTDSIQKKMDLSKTEKPARLAQAGTGAVSADRALMRDAREALVGLGYRENDVSALLNRMMAESNPAPKQAEDLIKAALRHLA